MKKNIVARTVFISGFLVLILIIVIFTTVYSHWGDPTMQALKDSLSTSSGIFGGLATLAAAIVAAYLFNDWKEQQKHQNSIHFGLEVYSNFKAFDQYFTKICNELIHLEYLLKEVINNNDNSLRVRFLNNSSETSKKNQELFNLYLNFQDSFTNYCIVTNQEELLIDIEETRDSFLKFYDVLTNIPFENSLEVKLQNILFLNSKPVNDITTYIYNYYIKQILTKLRL
ncbi:hypothetical protein [Acinetobacter sp. SEK570]|uniref:hypothetical protein n=1 Tax=unclassified Acinetobacter TaxID=196816 RepID=UPI0039A13BFD